MTWAVRVIAFAFAVSGAAWIVHAVRDRFDRTVREFDGMFDIDTDHAVALVCKPCHDEAGRCTCTWRCGHPDCIGDHTTFSRREVDELEALLKTEGNQS